MIPLSRRRASNGVGLSRCVLIYQIGQRITFSPRAQHSRPGQPASQPAVSQRMPKFSLQQQHPPVGGRLCVTTPRAKQARLMCGWVSRTILLLPVSVLPFSRLERETEIRQPSEGGSAKDKKTFFPANLLASHLSSFIHPTTCRSLPLSPFYFIFYFL